MSYGAKHQWRVILPLVLVVMVFMRLVWMQLRTFPISMDARTLLSLEFVSALGGAANSDCHLSPTLGPPSESDRAVFAARRETAVAFASPGISLVATALCRWDRLATRDLIQLNQANLVLTVLVATLLCRFATSSWTVSLIVAAMLMSRGRLLTDIGAVSMDHALMLGATIWFAVLAHFLRTAARLSLALSCVVTLILACIDPVMVGLPMTAVTLIVVGYWRRRELKQPLLLKLRDHKRQLRHLGSEDQQWAVEEPVGVFRSIFSRLAGIMRGMLGMELLVTAVGEVGERATSVELAGRVREEAPFQYERGSLLRTLRVPFVLWLYAHRRWLKLVTVWLAVSAAALLLYALALKGLMNVNGVERRALSLQGGWHELIEAFRLWQVTWWPYVTESWSQRLDLHLSVSIVLVVLSAMQGPGAGLPSFFEIAWLTIASTIVLLLFAAVADFCDVMVLRQMLAHGVAGAPLAALGPRGVLAWIEPVWLTLGVAGIYNLLKVVEQR